MFIDTTRVLQIMAVDRCSVTFEQNAEFGMLKNPDGGPSMLAGVGKAYLVEMSRSMRDDLLAASYLRRINVDERGQETYELTDDGVRVGLKEAV